MISVASKLKREGEHGTTKKRGPKLQLEGNILIVQLTKF